MAGTAWNNFSAGTLARASQVNQNFDWLEGSLATQLAGSQTNGVYDLGTSTAAWRNLYLSNSIVLGGLTLTSFNGTSIDLTAGVLEVNDLAITTAKIAANAVTQAVRAGSFGASGLPSGVTQTALTIITSGGPVIVFASAECTANTTAAGRGFGLYVARNTTTAEAMLLRYGNLVSLDEFTLSGTLYDNPAAGTHVYYMILAFDDTTTYQTITRANIVALELKK